MQDQDHRSRLWKFIGEAKACMLVTRFREGLRARPMEPRPDPEAEVIWFLTDVRGLKDDEIAADPHTCLIFMAHKEKAYLSITGRASVSRDPGRAKALWNAEQAVWWSGPDDPNLRVLRVDPERAEMWDGPASSAVASLEFAKARLTGTKPNLGEKRKFTVDMG